MNSSAYPCTSQLSSHVKTANVPQSRLESKRSTFRWVSNWGITFPDKKKFHSNITQQTDDKTQTWNSNCRLAPHLQGGMSSMDGTASLETHNGSPPLWNRRTYGRWKIYFEVTFIRISCYTCSGSIWILFLNLLNCWSSVFCDAAIFSNVASS